MSLNTPVTILLAALPAIALLFYIYYKDKVNKEPISLLLKLFVFGMLIVIPVIIVEQIIDIFISFIPRGSIVSASLEAFICAALTEELFKYLVVKKLTWNYPAFDSTFDGIVYCACVSLGFAAVENVMYALSMGSHVLPYRAVLAIPGHFAFSLAMGVLYSRAKHIDAYNKNVGASYDYKPYLRYALIIPVVFHGFYDFCLMVKYEAFLLVYALFITFMYRYILKTIKVNSRNDRLFL